MDNAIDLTNDETMAPGSIYEPIVVSEDEEEQQRGTNYAETKKFEKTKKNKKNKKDVSLDHGTTMDSLECGICLETFELPVR